jgi:ribosomal protein L18E
MSIQSASGRVGLSWLVGKSNIELSNILYQLANFSEEENIAKKVIREILADRRKRDIVMTYRLYVMQLENPNEDELIVIMRRVLKEMNLKAQEFFEAFEVEESL